MVKPVVRVLWMAEAWKHSHGPEPPSVQRRIDPSEVRILAWKTSVARLVLVRDVSWSVDSFDRNVGRVPELLLPLRAVLRPLFESLCLPFRFLALQLGEIFRVEG